MQYSRFRIYALYSAMGYKFDFDQRQMAYFRRRICYELIRDSDLLNAMHNSFLQSMDDSIVHIFNGNVLQTEADCHYYQTEDTRLFPSQQQQSVNSQNGYSSNKRLRCGGGSEKVVATLLKHQDGGTQEHKVYFCLSYLYCVKEDDLTLA